MDGVVYKKCKNMAFFHSLEERNFAAVRKLVESEIDYADIGAFNSCIKNRREIINHCITAISEILDTSKLEKQASNLLEECAVVTELIRKCVDENAHISARPKVYAEKYE